MAINLFNTSGILDRGRDSFKAAYDQGEAMRGDRTNMQAGRAYAGGDRQGAARMLAQGGNIDGARVLENDIQGDARQAMQDQTAAEQTRYTRGREAESDQRARQKDEAEKRVSVLDKVGEKLRGLPLGTGARKAKLMEAMPLFQWSGYPQEAIDQLAAMRDEDLSDDAIAMTTGKARSEFEKYFNVRNVGVVGMRRDGSSKVVRGAPLIYSDTQNVDMPIEDDEGDDLEGGPAADTLGGPSPNIYGGVFGSVGEDTIAGGSGQDGLPGYRRVHSARQPQGRGGSGRSSDGRAPSGYKWNGANLEPIKGGPADPAVKSSPGGGDQKEFASLRKEFNALDEVNKFKDTAASYNQIRTLTSNPKPSPADDIALIFSFMKMLDPGSVVREGEFALVGASAGVPDQVIMQMARATGGKGLTPKIRARLVDASAKILLERRAAYDTQSANYRQIAKDIGARPDLLAEDPTKWRGRIKGGAGAGAAPATVKGGLTSAEQAELAALRKQFGKRP